MEGKKFTIFAEGWASFGPLSINDIMAEELTGDSLNDAIYNRNVKVEKQYNCKVSFLEVGDTIAAHNQLKQSVMAADQSYDIAIIRTYNYLSAITNGLVMDISDIPNTDYTQPWWDQNSLDSLSVGGKAYAICSDITMNDEKSIWCVFFNKKMIDDYTSTTRTSSSRTVRGPMTSSSRWLRPCRLTSTGTTSATRKTDTASDI